jgi:uncharacterized protein
MKTFTRNEPLTDAELDRLSDFLAKCRGGKAMNIETLDGFFAALIAGPEVVMPSEYYREVFGGEISEAYEFPSIEAANDIFGLLMRQWNEIAGTLSSGGVLGPLLLEDDDGFANCNDWARGFMRGMAMRLDDWTALLDDDQHGGCLLPMMMLAHEHDPDPEMCPQPIGPEKRRKVITMMSVGVIQAYRFFRRRREANAGSAFTPGSRRSVPKTGRNDRCPCGSGKKYKRCCGGVTVN